MPLRKLPIITILYLLCVLSPKDVKAQCFTTSTPTNNCTYGDQINAFSLNSISATGNSGCGPSGYNSFSSPVWNLTIGQAYNWSATTGSGQYYQSVGIWIDLNNNGIYEASEMLANTPADLTHNYSFTIPTGSTAANNVRMRVRCAYSGTLGVLRWTGGTAACTNNVGSYGETEDYYVNLIAPCVNPTTPTLSATSSTICNGASTTLSIATGTLNSATTWSWYSGSCGGTAAGTGTSIVVSPTTTTTYYARGTGGCVTPGACAQITVTVNEPVVITTQPQASTTLCAGSTLNLSAAANNGMGYQWYNAGGPLSNVGNVSGANTANLQITNVTTAESNTYYVIVTGNTPCANVQSNNATVTVNDPILITTQPAATLTECEGNPINLSVTASNGAGYLWYKDGNPLSDVGSVSGSSTANLQITPSVAGDAGTYYVEITGNAPCANANSNNSVVTINAPVMITGQPPAAMGVCDGSDINLAVASSNGVSYQWYKDGNPLSDVGNVSGSSTSALLVAGSTAADAGTYYLEITGTAPCPIVNSNSTVVTTQYPAAIVTQPSSVTQCTGAGTSLTVGATGSGLTYQWRLNGGPLSDDATYSGTNTSTLNISSVTGLSGGTYDVVVTGICPPAATSSGVMITEDFNNNWHGAVSQDWNNTGNWSCGTIPTLTTNVLIPSTATNMPWVNITNAQANNITIDAGASLIFVGTANELQVAGNITDNGTFDASSGKVILLGTGAQNIPGVIYGNLDIMGGSVKTLDGDATVTGMLTLSSGHIVLDSNDLMLSTPWNQAGGSASSFIVTNDSGNVVGQGMGVGGNPDPVTFHVGTAVGSYNPITLENLGTVDTFMVRIVDSVFEDGYGVNLTTVDNPVVNKTWMVSETTPGGSIVNMTPFWNHPGDEINGFDTSHVYVAHYMGGMWTSDLDSALEAPGAMVVGNMLAAFEDSITSLSPFTVASSGPFPLNIKLIDVSAANAGSRNKVDWKSATEATGDSYVVETSADGKSFTQLATVQANGKPSAYTYWHQTPVTGVNYYRIKTVDADNKIGYSKVVSATVKATGIFAVEAFPNPVTSNVTVMVKGTVTGTGYVTVNDVTGKVIRSAVKVENNQAEISMSDVANGMYFINYSDDANQQSIKINKQ